MAHIEMSNIKLINFCKNEKWIILSILTAIVTGLIVVSEQWIYLGILIFPLVMVISHERSFIFPFGLYVLLLPLDSILTITGSSEGATITKFLGILTIIVLFFKGIFEHKLKRPDNAAIWLMLFIFYGILSFTWAISPQAVLGSSKTFVGIFFLYFIVSSYEIQKSDFDTLKLLIIFGGLLASANIIYTYLTGGFSDYHGRATLAIANEATDPNRFAFTLIIPVAVSILMILEKKAKWIMALFSVIISILIFCVIITGSRGTMVAVGVIIAVYMISAKQRLSLWVVLIILGFILIPLVPEMFFERWEKAVDTGGAGRLDVWTIGLHSLKKYFLTGAGLNNFPLAFNEFGHILPFMKTDFRAHNIYLALSVELGIIGMALFGLAIKGHYRAIHLRTDYRKNDSVMLKASFWGILSASFFLDTLFIKSFWLLWMMIMMHRNLDKNRMLN